MTLPARAIILVDDNDPAFNYGPGWVKYPEETDIGSSTGWARDANNTSVEFPFNGTSVSFSGNTPHGGFANLTAAIDGGPSTFISTSNDGFDQLYRPWYISPVLADGAHTLSLGNLTGIALDYVTFTAGLSTSLQGRTLIVDDSDPAITYTGRWAESTESFVPFPTAPPMMTFQNTTHSSNTPGDSLTFQFTGTSVSVYGVVPWQLVGNFSVDYVVDGTLRSSRSLSSDGSDPSGVYTNRVNFQYFTTDLDAGDHTLFLNLTENIGTQAFIFDYILYQPSFSTLATMPNLTLPSTAPPNASPSILTPSSRKMFPVKALTGGLIGGLLFLALFVFILWRCRRKLQARDKRKLDPFTGRRSFDDVQTISQGPLALTTPNPVNRQYLTPFSTFGPTYSTAPSEKGTVQKVSLLALEKNAVAERQAELRRQVRDMQVMMDQLVQDDPGATISIPSDNASLVVELQRQINLLVQENTRLQTMQPDISSTLHEDLAQPPPAYVSNPITAHNPSV